MEMGKYDHNMYNHHNLQHINRTSFNLKKRSLCPVRRIHNIILIYNKIKKRGEKNDYLLLDHNNLQVTSQCCIHLSESKSIKKIDIYTYSCAKNSFKTGHKATELELEVMINSFMI